MEYTEELAWCGIFCAGNGRFSKTYAKIYSALRLELKEFGHISEAQNMLPCRILNCPGHPRFPRISTNGYSICDFCEGCMMKIHRKPTCPNCGCLARIEVSSIDASCDPSDYYELVIYCEKCDYYGRLQVELTP